LHHISGLAYSIALTKKHSFCCVALVLSTAVTEVGDHLQLYCLI